MDTATVDAPARCAPAAATRQRPAPAEGRGDDGHSRQPAARRASPPARARLGATAWARVPHGDEPSTPRRRRRCGRDGGADADTGATNRNPRFGSVCTNRGLSPLSPKRRAHLPDAVGQTTVVVHVRVTAPDRRRATRRASRDPPPPPAGAPARAPAAARAPPAAPRASAPRSRRRNGKCRRSKSSRFALRDRSSEQRLAARV